MRQLKSLVQKKKGFGIPAVSQLLAAHVPGVSWPSVPPGLPHTTQLEAEVALDDDMRQLSFYSLETGCTVLMRSK